MTTRIFVDSSTRRACYIVEGLEPIIVPYLEPVTNNVGEYQAVILALEEAKRLGLKQVELLTDSEFVANQVNGYDKFGNKWRKCLPHLLPLRNRVRELAQTLQATIRWVPREDNLAGRVLEELDKGLCRRGIIIEEAGV